MSDSEFSRVVKVRPLPAAPLELEASEAERAALAERFGIVAVDSLKARVELSERGKAVMAEGKLSARIVQSCAISGEDFPVEIDESLAFRFVPPAKHSDEPDMEIELDAEELDEIEYEGESFDLGEAIAQTLGLAIDPYAEGPNADAARKDAGITSDDAPSGPLAEALAALKKD
ncbi:DUF177 domain-containing protein [Erythrobacter sp. HKB08]|uniref:YceD family protein n=1 Tax=Erythrobacter sp. HKB08 TaxID=2502843 RepID=UPI00100899A5|nr:DUF177 domain-containing protein [Erythrobacter sp. HKB08]